MDVFITSAIGTLLTGIAAYTVHIIKSKDIARDDKINSLNDKVNKFIERKEVMDLVNKIEDRIENLITRNDEQHKEVAKRLDQLIFIELDKNNKGK